MKSRATPSFCMVAGGGYTPPIVRLKHYFNSLPSRPASLPPVLRPACWVFGLSTVDCLSRAKSKGRRWTFLMTSHVFFVGEADALGVGDVGHV